MKVWRKPETAEWYYDSAQLVDDVALKVKPWVNELRIMFDATKDKEGERHTTMKLSLTEKEVEHLYQRMMQGRKEALRDAHREIKKHSEDINKVSDDIEEEVSKVDLLWRDAIVGSSEEAFLLQLKESLVELAANVRLFA